jgi:Flp pilus assembly protein TadB
MADNPYSSPKVIRPATSPRSGVRWKRVFLYALAAAAVCIAVIVALWSIHPSEIIDFSAPNGEFFAILHRVRIGFALGMWVSLLSALIGLFGWGFSGR